MVETWIEEYQRLWRESCKAKNERLRLQTIHDKVHTKAYLAKYDTLKTLALLEVVIVHGEEISCGGLFAGSGSVRYVLSCSGSPLSWQWDQALAALTRLTSCVWTSIVRNEQSSAADGGVHRFTAFVSGIPIVPGRWKVEALTI